MLGLLLRLYSVKLKVVMSFRSSLQQYSISIHVGKPVCIYKSQENELGRTSQEPSHGRNQSFKKILCATEVYTFDSVTTTKWIGRYKEKPSFLKWQR